MTPYRDPAAVPPDEEAIALARLAGKARRMRRLVSVPILVAGLVVGAALYLLLRDRLFAGIDARAPYITALVAVLPIVVAAQTLAAYVSRACTRARSGAWIAEIAAEPGGSRMLLEAFVRAM
jgi:hypothetical protein